MYDGMPFFYNIVAVFYVQLCLLSTSCLKQLHYYILKNYYTIILYLMHNVGTTKTELMVVDFLVLVVFAFYSHQ